MKACPYCAEQIQDAAIVCRFCGRDLPGHSSPPPREAAGTAAAADAGRPPAGDEPVSAVSTALIAVLGAAVLLALIAVAYSVFAGPDQGAPSTTSVAAGADGAGAGGDGAGGGLPVPGRWTTSTEPAAGGGADVYAMVSADDVAPPAAGVARPTLVLRCADRRTDLYITWFLPVGSETVDLQTHVDDVPAETGTWSVSTDGQSTFYEGDAAALVRGWMDRDALRAEVPLPGQRPIAAAFDLSGMDDAVGPVRDACAWD